MLKNYIITTLRFLKRQKLYSFIKKNRNNSQDLLIENLKAQINNWAAEDKIKDDIVFLTMEMLSD